MIYLELFDRTQLLIVVLYCSRFTFGFLFFRKLFLDLCGGSLQPSLPHPTHAGEKLFLIFDFTHNLKNIFNCFLNKGYFDIPTKDCAHFYNDSCTPQFCHIEKLYALEEHKVLKVAHKLKKNSLNPSNIARTSPQHALSKYKQSLSISLKSHKLY